MLSGSKTYIVSVLFVLYAIVGVVIGEVEWAEAGRILLEGGGFAALRAGVAKKIGV